MNAAEANEWMATTPNGLPEKGISINRNNDATETNAGTKKRHQSAAITLKGGL